jgi:hypothetical protein
MSELVFKNWKARASSIGKLMGSLNKITQNQLDELRKLEERVLESMNNPKLALTENMRIKLGELKAKRDAPDELSKGAKSYLDEVFRDLFWKRKRFLANKYLEKGNFQEQNALDLLSKVDNAFYSKNDEYFENEYVCGTPDNVDKIVRDTKCSFDLESFENSDITTLYESQIKAYCWLTNLNKGQLVYCCVNNPVHQILNEKTRMFYQAGNPDDDNESWIKAIQQLERNMVFDIKEFQEEFPHYVFQSKILDFTIPPQFRVKKFDIELYQEDIDEMKLVVMLARKYLCEKEIEIYEKNKN